MHTGNGSVTEERIARNDATFRAANERIGETAREYEMSGAVPFICECAEPACTEVVQLRLEEYESVRSDSRRFLNAPGHQVAARGAADVVERHDGYIVVEKTGLAGEVAEQLDARNRADC